MPLKRYIYRIERLDQLIRLRATGTPAECASKLGISKRTLYELINELKEDFSFPIEYNRGLQSFVYSKQGAMSSLNFDACSNGR
ncbi:MAG: hypothetical protein AAF843_18945 [Bacteroidota bacterium]